MFLAASLNITFERLLIGSHFCLYYKWMPLACRVTLTVFALFCILAIIVIPCLLSSTLLSAAILWFRVHLNMIILLCLVTSNLLYHRNCSFDIQCLPIWTNKAMIFGSSCYRMPNAAFIGFQIDSINCNKSCQTVCYFLLRGMLSHLTMTVKDKFPVAIPVFTQFVI